MGHKSNAKEAAGEVRGRGGENVNDSNALLSRWAWATA